MNGHAHLVPTTAPPPFLLSRSTPRFLFHRLMLAPPPTHPHKLYRNLPFSTSCDLCLFSPTMESSPLIYF